VGIVKDVSENFCTVISFLHKDSRISARVKKNNYIGSMVWDGFRTDEGSLKDIAKHVKLQKGDSIITSSFSAIFPEGIMIGTVRSVENDPSENFFHIKVGLSTSFGSLSHVYIVNNLMKDEQRSLEALEKDAN
jgi:rod shape-determining protein MreC